MNDDLVRELALMKERYGLAKKNFETAERARIDLKEALAQANSRANSLAGAQEKLAEANKSIETLRLDLGRLGDKYQDMKRAVATRDQTIGEMKEEIRRKESVICTKIRHEKELQAALEDNKRKRETSAHAPCADSSAEGDAIVSKYRKQIIDVVPRFL